MALRVARTGWVGVGVEVTPGVPVAMSTNLYEVKETLAGKAKPIQQDAAYSQRDKVFSGSPGETWGEGELEWNLDPIITPYLLGAGLGTIADSTISGAVTQHTLSQNQSSVPLTLSLYRSRGVDQQLFSYAAVDTLDIGFAVDKFATGKTTIKSFMPVDSVSGTVTRNATTLFTWGGAQLQFGTSIANALSQVAEPTTDFTYMLKNNTVAVFESGTLNTTRVAHKDFNLSGDYTQYFENTGDRNNYYQTISEAMVLSFFGAKLGAYTEEVQLQIPNSYLDTFSVETGLDNFYIEKAKYVAEYSTVSGFTTQAVVTNNSATP